MAEQQLQQLLETILGKLSQQNNATKANVTTQLKLALNNMAIIPALCAVMTGSQNPQVRQSAAVMLSMGVKKHGISPDHKESLKAAVLQAFTQESEHTVCHSLSQLCRAVLANLCIDVLDDGWPELLKLFGKLLNQDSQDRQVVPLLVESNPEPFEPHYPLLLEEFNDQDNLTTLHYHTLTAITAYIGSEKMNLMHSLIPKMIAALKNLTKADQEKASEMMMKGIDKMINRNVKFIDPIITVVVPFCLEVCRNTRLSDSVRVKALNCIASLIMLRSNTLLNQNLLLPMVQTIFLSAEDQEDDATDNPKHCAAQIIDTMASHRPLKGMENLATVCFDEGKMYEGCMYLALMAMGCPDNMRTKLSNWWETVCQSLSDSDHQVSSAALFALGQFSEHLQVTEPDDSKYCEELVPLLLGYIDRNQAKVGHATKAFYVLENFIENLGEKMPTHWYPKLMKEMLHYLTRAPSGPFQPSTHPGQFQPSGPFQPSTHPGQTKTKIKELAVSAISAIANTGKGLLTSPDHLASIDPVIESLKGFLTATTVEMRALQTQALDTLSVLARNDTLSPTKATECVQLGLLLTQSNDDPDLRRCTYRLYSAVSTVSLDCLTPHLTDITDVMYMALTKEVEWMRKMLVTHDKPHSLNTDDLELDKILDQQKKDQQNMTGLNIAAENKEGVVQAYHANHLNTAEKDCLTESLTGSLNDIVALLDLSLVGVVEGEALIDDEDDNENDNDDLIKRHAYIVEMIDALGEIAFNVHVSTQSCAAFQPFREVIFSPVLEMTKFPHDDVRRAAFGAICQFCRGQHKLRALPGTDHQALQTMLNKVLPCYVEAVGNEWSGQMIMSVLWAMYHVVQTCQEEVFKTDSRLQEICHAIRDVLKKKKKLYEHAEEKAEFDAELLVFARAAIDMLASAVPAETSKPFLSDLLTLIREAEAESKRKQETGATQE